MKFNVFYHIKRPAGLTLAPDLRNPIEAENLSMLMHGIVAAVKPKENTIGLGVTYTGIEIKPVEGDNGP